MSDSLSNAKRVRILTIIDDFTRESPGILVARSIPSRKATAFIDHLALFRGYPRRIRVDNGSEFTSAWFHTWAEKQTITVEYTRLEKPSDNAFIGSFNGKIRDECLNEHWFLSIADAQSRVENWRNSTMKNDPIAH